MSLYIVSIGGTGAKCVESIIHLAAAGLFGKEKKEREIIFCKKGTTLVVLNSTDGFCLSIAAVVVVWLVFHSFKPKGWFSTLLVEADVGKVSTSDVNITSRGFL